MQIATSFFEKVLPPLPMADAEHDFEACYFSLGIKGDARRQTATHFQSSLATTCEQLANQGFNSYMALFSFKDKDLGRKKTNAYEAKCLWADIDAGKQNSKYATYVDALKALVPFCVELNFTPTYIIKSGKGLHVYWVLSHALQVNNWLKLAHQFKAVCQLKGLDVDPARAEDPSSVLRCPGTIHQSSGNVVEVLKETDHVYDPSELLTRFQQIVPVGSPVPTVSSSYNKLDESEMEAMGLGKNLTANAETLAHHCNQIRTMGTGSYQQWTNALIVLQHCYNGKEWAHTLSAIDKRYDPDATEKKFNEFATFSPCTCEAFQACNPEGCQSCKHRGTVKSPISLGRLSIPKLVVVEQPKQDSNEDLTDVEKFEQQLKSPFEYPLLTINDKLYSLDGKAYYKIDDRGVVVGKPFKNKETGETEWYETILCESKIYFKYTTFKRDDDGRVHRSFVFEIHRPYNNEKEELAFIVDKDLTTNGIVQWFFNGKTFFNSSLGAKECLSFMNTYLNAIVPQSPELHTFDTFGWQPFTDPKTKEKTEGFVVGSGIITDSGVHDIKFGDSTSFHAKEFKAQGTLEGWRDGVDLYKNLNQPAGQLGVCFSLAAPFMRYGLGEAHSAIYSLWSSESGKGKSQVLRAAASVWGDPEQQFVSRMASVPARSRRMAVLKNLPVFMDEMTDVSDDDMFNLAYTLVGGKEKDKLYSNGAKFVETGTWNTVSFTTANKSFKAAIASKAGDSDATLLRVIEYYCDFKSYESDTVLNAYINTCIAQTRKNYGIAGPYLMAKVLERSDRLATLPSRIERWVQDYQFQNNERFMSSPLAIALIVGRWAVEFGILDYDMDALEDWVVHRLVPHNRESTLDFTASSADFLSVYLNERLKDTLIVRRARRKSDEKELDVMRPLGPLNDEFVILYPKTNTINVRVEYENHSIYINPTDLKAWCEKKNISPSTLRRKLKELGIPLDTVPKDLGGGLPYIATPRTRCYKLDNEDALEVLGYDVGKFFERLEARANPAPTETNEVIPPTAVAPQAQAVIAENATTEFDTSDLPF
jgi:hypothetical protein